MSSEFIKNKKNMLKTDFYNLAREEYNIRELELYAQKFELSSFDDAVKKTIIQDPEKISWPNLISIFQEMSYLACAFSQNTYPMWEDAFPRIVKKLDQPDTEVYNSVKGIIPDIRYMLDNGPQHKTKILAHKALIAVEDSKTNIIKDMRHIAYVTPSHLFRYFVTLFVQVKSHDKNLSEFIHLDTNKDQETMAFIIRPVSKIPKNLEQHVVGDIEASWSPGMINSLVVAMAKSKTILK